MSRNDTNIKISSPTANDYVGQQTGYSSTTKLISGNIYKGKILQVDISTKTYTVKVGKQSVSNCVLISNCIASLLGFSSTSIPPVGADVICLYLHKITYILGIQPQTELDINTYSGSINGGDVDYIQSQDEAFNTNYKNKKRKETSNGYVPERDLFPGEQVITNNMGVFLRFLHNLIQMDAGGLAKVECHLVNDMVRLIDNYFVHHNCGGDTLIWNNGRCNYEDHFTSYPFEAEGKLYKEQTFAEQSEENEAYVLSQERDPYDQTGRWRKSTYVGFLGDMVHYWITNPTDVISTYAEDAARAGRFKTWVGMDGTLMVQSAGDILLNVTQHMIIPQMVHKWDNPKIDNTSIMEDLNKEYLKIWGEGEKHWQSLEVACWQMRNYLKYLTLWHSLARFRQMAENNVVKISTEKESPVGNTDCAEEDRKDVNATTQAGTGHAILHICPDGSISLISGDTSSIIMNNGNIQISAANNVEIKAGGTFSVTSKDISMKAYNSVEILSMMGSLWLKARTAFNALCEKGRMWLKSDADGSFDDTATGEIITDSLEFNKYAIVIDASKGETLLHGNTGLTVGTTDANAHVNIQTKQASSDIKITSANNIYGISKQAILFNAQRFGLKAVVSKITGSVIKLLDRMRIASNVIDVDSVIRCKRLATEGNIFALNGYIGNSKYVGVYKEVKPEVYKPDVESEDCDKAGSDAEALNFKLEFKDYEKEEFLNGASTWNFKKWYYTDTDDPLDPYSLKADIWTDTCMYCESYYSLQAVQVNWNIKSNTIISSTRTSDKNLPWPGNNAKLFCFDTGEPVSITQPWERDFDAYDRKTNEDLVQKDMVFYFIKD